MNKQWVVRRSSKEDDLAIRELLRDVSQGGIITLGFEREPSYFNAVSVSYCQPEIYVYEDLSCKRIVGVFSAGLREVYINGTPQLIRYTGDLRVHPDYQGTRVMFRMAKQLKAILGNDGWAHTVILSENKKSLNTVSKARGGMPKYFQHCRFNTHTIFPQRKLLKKHARCLTRQASYKDINTMQEFFDREAPKKQFFPHYEFSQLENDEKFYQGLSFKNFHLAFAENELVGIFGLWNQGKFKQTRVIDYKFSLLRNLYNFFLQGVQST